VAETVDPLRQAWRQSYQDAAASLALARTLQGQADIDAAEAQLLVALGAARLVPVPEARAELEQARRLDATAPAHPRAEWGQALCDELEAMLRRRESDVEGSARLQAEIDARPAGPRSAMDRFIAQNSRAITTKLQGRADDSLRHLHAALDAAQQTGWPGPVISAGVNLGGRHHDLYNLEDARQFSLQGLNAAAAAGAKMAQLVATCNLVYIHHALGEQREAHDMGLSLAALLPGETPEQVLDMTPPLALGWMAGDDPAQAEQLLREVQHATVRDPASQWSLAWGWEMARCLLMQGRAGEALAAAQQALQAADAVGGAVPCYDLMVLHRTLCDAAEQTGQAALALKHLREGQSLYERLVGRSARARYIALDVTHQLAQARHERDVAVDGRRSVEDDRQRLSELNAALQAQMAETQRLHEQLREQALRDPLTGLHNRRYLFELAPGLLERARRNQQPLSVVLLDLDHFKLLNDTCGHAAGDLVLQRFATLLAETLRRSDVICRHGGEEFVALMPDTQADEAEAVMQRLLETFSVLQLELGRRRLPRGTFSAGIALFPGHGSTLEQLLSRADRALYAAKHHGRARIEQVPRSDFTSMS
jgi:diguanylate cyclase (GGDEF)-like protein